MSDEDKTLFQPAPKKKKNQLAKGDVLNGIYRIIRFIAKGGMGEVYEGENIHPPHERVAIKLILPQVAADETVTAMFAKEAETLIRLSHEAIASYRLTARDETGRPFIVTAFIDGPSLEDRLAEISFSDEEFGSLAERLARGLGEAHSLGAIHRDIAPDNILLVNGNPNQPKIIDFGIAKDAREDNEGKTLIGDGFAGKLKYVAPEQLGEFGRNIGPWSDVYSLALTLLSVAMRKHVDMGGSIADSVRKRQAVPDLEAIPKQYRPAFEAALQPDPKKRLQSMEEFIDRLKPEIKIEAKKGRTVGLILGSSIIGASILFAILTFNGRVDMETGGLNNSSGGETSPDNPGSDVSGPAPIDLGSPEFTALAENVAQTPECSWLTYNGFENGTAFFKGGAGNLNVTKDDLAAEFGYENVEVAIDMSDVVTFDPLFCNIIDTMHQYRPSQDMISLPYTEYTVGDYELGVDATGAPRTINVASPEFRISNLNSAEDLFILEVKSNGEISPLLPSRSGVENSIGILGGSENPDGYDFKILYQPEGIKRQGFGIIMISGQVPFPPDLLGDPNDEDSQLTITPGWRNNFVEQANEKNWKVDMVWFHMIDNSIQ
ncbi:MAG: serine/threonine protein kinase [Hellea sp.]|nr:serine/threonine protein kinase [Hellea sp.]